MNERVETVRIVLGDGATSGSLWVVLLLVGAGALVVGAAVIGWARWRRRRNPLDSAFASLARGMGLPRPQRDEVLALAGRCGIPAAVLLVSASARAEAARRLTAIRT